MQIALDDQVMTARRPGSPPPSVALAEWLAAVYPRKAGREAAEVAGPEGAVVTFLEDGEEGIKAGHATRVSMAETMADPDQVATSPEVPAPKPRAPSPSPSPSPVPTPSTSRRGIALALSIALVTGSVIVVFWMRGRREGVGGEGVRGGGVKGVDAQVVAVDAAVVARAVDAGVADAQVIAVAAIDAGVKTPRKRPDAGPVIVRTKIDAGVAQPPGKVRVQSSPWAEVEVVGRGKKCNDTPCTIELPAGRYTLRLRNPPAGLGASREVTVVSGDTVDVSAQLTRPLEP
jgi:hypothetical protein